MTEAPSSNTDLPKWDPHVIGAVGLVCFIFLVFSYYKMIERNCTNIRIINRSRNHDQRRRLNEHLEDLSFQYQSRGLDSCVMHSIPITQIKKNKNEEEEEECHVGSTECAVCLGEFEEGEWVKNLPNCSHVFHVSCIDMWFQMHSTCPLCRAIVYKITTTPSHECSIHVQPYMEALDREDFRRDRLEHYQVMRDSHRVDLEPLIEDNESSGRPVI